MEDLRLESDSPIPKFAILLVFSAYATLSKLRIFYFFILRAFDFAFAPALALDFGDTEPVNLGELLLRSVVCFGRALLSLVEG